MAETATWRALFAFLSINPLRTATVLSGDACAALAGTRANRNLVDLNCLESSKEPHYVAIPQPAAPRQPSVDSPMRRTDQSQPTKHWTPIGSGPTLDSGMIRIRSHIATRERIIKRNGDQYTMKNTGLLTGTVGAGSPRRLWRWFVFCGLAASYLLVLATPLQAQADPWDQAVQVLQTAFTGTIAKGLSLVAIVVGGLMFAFGEGQSKRALAGIIFGVGMAIGAVNFMAWLFP
jgi:type IV secretory pathway VirB2 component (pilin)